MKISKTAAAVLAISFPCDAAPALRASSNDLLARHFEEAVADAADTLNRNIVSGHLFRQGSRRELVSDQCISRTEDIFDSIEDETRALLESTCKPKVSLSTFTATLDQAKCSAGLVRDFRKACNDNNGKNIGVSLEATCVLKDFFGLKGKVIGRNINGCIADVCDPSINTRDAEKLFEKYQGEVEEELQLGSVKCSVKSIKITVTDDKKEEEDKDDREEPKKEEDAGDPEADIEITQWWPQGKPFPDVTASVGDTLSFQWTEGYNHNVYIHPSGDCSTEGAIFVGETTPTTFTIMPKYAGKTITFACDVGNHCAGGQIINVVVAGEGNEEGAGSDFSKSFQVKSGATRDCSWVAKDKGRCGKKTATNKSIANICAKECAGGGDDGDDASEKFELKSGAVVGCSWVTAVESKKGKRCGLTTANGKSVTTMCPRECPGSGGAGNAQKNFKLKSGAVVSCSWAANVESKKGKRCGLTTANNEKVEDLCRGICGSN